MAWIYNPNEFEPKEYTIIPEGDHRVRIIDVVEKTFKSGNSGYEITFEVSGFSNKLWYYLVLNPADTKKTNQRIGSFFESFGITNPDLSHYRTWIGKVGAVCVKHETFNGFLTPKPAFCLNKKRQEGLPEAKFSAATTTAAPANNAPLVEVGEDDLPF